MIHLRIVTPPEKTRQVEDRLAGDDAVCNVITLAGAARRPDGDVIMADVAREDASIVVGDVRRLGVGAQEGSIAIEHVDTSLGPDARRAMSSSLGEESDAVVWEEVQTRTSEEAQLSWSYLVFMVLAAALATCGLFTDNPILIVGAMVVSPDFGPLAGLCVGVVTRRRRLVGRSLAAVVVGFPVASAVAYVLSEVLLGTGVADKDFSVETSGLATFIATPDAYTFIIAFCAGAAGTLSLTTAKSGALIGVLISVTTIPAACDIGVSAATRDWSSMGGSAVQLAANIVTIVVAGSLTLYLQRRGYLRRREHHEGERGRVRATGTDRATTTPRAWLRSARRPRP